MNDENKKQLLENELEENAPEEFNDIDFEETNDDGEVTQKLKINKLRLKIEALEKEKKQYLDGWQRAQADYKNLSRESETKSKDASRFAVRKFASALLPVMDAYDMARSNKQSWEAVDKNWRVGIEYIFGQLEASLSSMEVKAFGAAGDIIDLAKYEAVETLQTDVALDDMKVATVLTRGYSLGETILRPARVIVFQNN